MATTPNVIRMVTEGNIDILLEAKNLLGPEGENWTKGATARDAENNQTHYISPKAVKFDLLGAMMRARYNLGLTTDEDLKVTALNELMITLGMSVVFHKGKAIFEGGTVSGYNDSQTEFYPISRALNITIERLRRL